MLFKHIKRQTNSLLNRLFSDPEMVTEIIYKKFDSEDYDEATGKTTFVYVEYDDVFAIRSNTALEAQGTSSVLNAIGFEAGEMFFFLRKSDIPRDNLYDSEILKDYITADGKDYQVRKCVPIFDIFARIQV